MNPPWTGGCVCGDVRYECGGHPLLMLKCHCRDCQRMGGAPYAPWVIVPWTALRITRGALRHHATTRLNGRPNLRGFCARCGSRLTVGEDRGRGLIGLAACSLDDPGRFRPEMDIFVCDAQPWDAMDADAIRHQHYPPRPTRPGRLHAAHE